MIFCKDCRHVSMPQGQKARCERPRPKEHHPVYGYERGFIYYAETERSDHPERCGPQARFFEGRPA